MSGVRAVGPSPHGGGPVPSRPQVIADAIAAAAKVADEMDLDITVKQLARLVEAALAPVLPAPRRKAVRAVNAPLTVRPGQVYEDARLRARGRRVLVLGVDGEKATVRRLGSVPRSAVGAAPEVTSLRLSDFFAEWTNRRGERRRFGLVLVRDVIEEKEAA